MLLGKEKNLIIHEVKGDEEGGGNYEDAAILLQQFHIAAMRSWELEQEKIFFFRIFLFL